VGIVSEVDKIEQNVYLPFVLRLLGIAVLAITVWKGVHGGFPTAGLIFGAVLLLAAAVVGARLEKLFSGLTAIVRVAAFFVLAVTIWKGVHGVWPTTGAIIGGAMLLVGGMFNKIYK
jgi:hypothetical protein